MAPPIVKNSPRDMANQNYNEAMQFADNKAEECVSGQRQRKPSDVVVFPPINIHDPVPSLIKTYLATHQRFRDLHSMNMKGSSFGRKGVPVTSPYDSTHTYHIVQFQEYVGGPIFQFPVRECDGYVGGWRVLVRPEDAETEAWFEFALFHLPRSLFVNVVPTSYDFAYTSITSIKLSSKILPAVSKFLLTTRNWYVAQSPNPHKRKAPAVTPEGIVYFNTMIFLCGEGRRYWLCLKFSCQGLQSIIPISPDDDMEKMVKSWGNASEHILSLYLAELEEKMGLITNLHELVRHGFRRFLAEDSLMALEKKCNGMLRCTGPDKEIKSEYLCNGDILLLKHHKGLVQKILMRQRGFRGAFKDTAKFVPIEHGAWRKGKFIIKEEDITQYLKFLEERRPWAQTDLEADAHTGQSSRQMDAGQSSCKSLDMETNLIIKVLEEQLSWPQTDLETDAHTGQSSRQMDAGQSSWQSEDMETNLDAERSFENDEVQIYLDAKLATQMMLDDLNELSVDNSKLLPLQGPQPAQEPSSSAVAGVHVLHEKVVEITKVQTKSFHEGCLGRRLVRQLLKDFMWLLGPEVYSSATAGVFLDKTMLQEAISNLLNGEGMQDIVKTMIPKTFPKEILHVLMTECVGKYPEWLLAHKENLDEEKYKQCESQIELIMNLGVVYEGTPENFSKILQLMYRIGRCGFPPSDIISGISPHLVEQLFTGMLELLQSMDKL